MADDPARPRATLLGGISSFAARRARWLVIGWLVLVAALAVIVPSVESVAARDSSSFLPGDAPSAQTQEVLDEAFGSGRGNSVVFVVLEDEQGLGRTDLAFYRSVAADLAADTEHVASVQSFATDPALRRALVSEDGEAAYLVVSLPGETGSPKAREQVEAVRALVADDRPEGLSAHVTGPTATIADMGETIDASIAKVTVATAVLILLILLLVYRSLAAMTVALLTIGVGLGLARGVIAALGDAHLLHVSTFTTSFMTAVVMGAGTDYAVFQISRYHELRRAGVPAAEAVPAANAKVGSVVVGSALTVVVATGAMTLAHLGIFNTTGPAIAISILCTLATSLTFTPALMALLAGRGWLEPRSGERSQRRWARVAAFVVARPARVLLAGLAVLALLAAFYPWLEPSYDERSGQPASTDSNQGYTALAAHYPINELLPDYVVLQADHDLRNPRDLATLESVARSLAAVPDVEEVRGITRPLGRPLPQATLAYQAGAVGDRLGAAGDRVRAGQDGVRRLAEGAGQVADGAGRLAAGADRAAAGTARLLDGLEREYAGLDAATDGAAASQAGAARLRDAAATLAAGLRTAADQTAVAVDGLAMVLDGLRSSPTCGLDPACSQSRDGLARIHAAERDRLLPGLRRAADGAEAIARGNGDLADGLGRLRDGLAQAREGVTRLQAGQRSLQGGLVSLADAAGSLAGGAAQVQDGTDRVAGSVGRLGAGIDRAATYLQRTGEAADHPATGGFYLPGRALDDPRFALASGFYLSQDGRTARFVVLGHTDSFSHAAMQRAAAERDAAALAIRGTRLADADLGATGIAPSDLDIDAMARRDFLLVAGGALLAVFLILVGLLRSLVAPLLLVASVALSYAAAMGLSVLVWQVLLDQPLEWTVPSIAFILLVAVGADYNLLLMKRMREDAPHGEPAGIARSVASTGSVITTAGLIFAASMFAMMFGAVTSLEQVGFTIGAGLLLDTFVVRTLVVPAASVLLGRALWWPRLRWGGLRLDGSAPRTRRGAPGLGGPRALGATRAAE